MSIHLWIQPFPSLNLYFCICIPARTLSHALIEVVTHIYTVYRDDAAPLSNLHLRMLLGGGVTMVFSKGFNDEVSWTLHSTNDVKVYITLRILTFDVLPPHDRRVPRHVG